MNADDMSRGGGRASSFLALRLAQYGLLFVSATLMARALGPAGRAEYALPLALSGSIAMLINLSLEGAAGRMLAHREATLHQVTRVLAGAVIAMALGGIALTLAIGLPARSALLAGASDRTIVLAALTVPCVLAIQMAGYLLLIMGALKEYGVIAASAAAVQLGLAVGLYASDAISPESATLATLVGFALTGLPMAAVLGRRLGWTALAPNLEREVTGKLLRVGVALHPASIALQFGVRLDLLVVGSLTTASETGLYSLAVTLAEATFLASRQLSLVALRAQTYKEEEAAVSYTFDFTRQILLLSAVTAVIGGAVAYPFVLLAFGQSWTGSVVPLVILLVAMVAITLESPPRALLTRLVHPGFISVLACGAVVLNVVLTVALIAPMGIIGAALASAIAYWCHALATAWLLERVTKRPARELFGPPRPGDYVTDLAARVSSKLGAKLGAGSAR